MSRNKTRRLLSLSLAALLFSNSVVFASEPLDEPQDIIDVEQFTQDPVSYETAEAVRGNLIGEVSVTATQYYPYTYNLQFEQDNAKFIEFTVQVGDEVKKGDVLARFTIDKSQAELTRLKLNLQRTQEQTNNGIREREQEIIEKRAELAEASDEYEKKLLELTIKKLEIGLEQYKYRQQCSINQAQEFYNEEYARRTTDVLVSPVDGIVRNHANKMVDEAVSSNERLITIVSGESNLLMAPNESGSLRYNMPVEVRMGSTADAIWLTGRVVAADDAIPAAERTGYALIQLDPYDEEEYTIPERPQVKVESVRVDNVLLVPAKAVTYEPNMDATSTLGDEIPYVSKLVDGAEQKRYVYTALSNMKETWVLTGVEEGDTLIVGVKKGG